MSTTMDPGALGHALRRTPPHLVLLLREGNAELYHSRAGSLVPMTEEGFPLEQAGPPAGASARGEDLDAFLLRVDEAFGRVRARHPSPMVLAGPDDLLTAFGDLSQSLYRLAGLVTGQATDTGAALYDAAQSVVEPYLLSREAEALWTLEHALTSRPDDVATGIDACCAAVRRRRPVMLVAEERLARVEGDILEGLLEVVIDGGGWVALARDGALGRHGGIALVLEPSAAGRLPGQDQVDELADGRA